MVSSGARRRHQAESQLLRPVAKPLAEVTVTRSVPSASWHDTAIEMSGRIGGQPELAGGRRAGAAAGVATSLLLRNPFRTLDRAAKEFGAAVNRRERPCGSPPGSVGNIVSGVSAPVLTKIDFGKRVDRPSPPGVGGRLSGIGHKRTRRLRPTTVGSPGTHSTRIASGVPAWV
jgi:hypothetical protein